MNDVSTCNYDCHYCRVLLTWENAVWEYCVCCDNYTYGHRECFEKHQGHHVHCKDPIACVANWNGGYQ